MRLQTGNQLFTCLNFLSMRLNLHGLGSELGVTLLDVLFTDKDSFFQLGNMLILSL